MHLIVYLSEHIGSPDQIDGDLADIVRVAKAANPARGITGVLFFHNGRFVQVIEGEEDALRALMTDIEHDSRHRNIQYLVDEPVTKRGFSDWNMDSFNLDDSASLDPAAMKRLLADYKRNLLPRADTLVSIYKHMLAAYTATSDE